MKNQPLTIPVEAWLQAGREAAKSLAAWIGREVRLDWAAPEPVAIEAAAELLGTPDSVVAACILDVTGAASGRLVMVADPIAIACFVNGMMGGEPVVTPEQRSLATDNPHAFWDELSRSAALETANIMACAYLNALAAAYQEQGLSAAQAQLVPSPPRFVLDYAASLGEFLLAQLPESLEGVTVSKSRMHLDDAPLNDWGLVWIPSSLPGSAPGEQ